MNNNIQGNPLHNSKSGPGSGKTGLRRHQVSTWFKHGSNFTVSNVYMNIDSSGPRRSRFRDGMDDDFDLEIELHQWESMVISMLWKYVWSLSVDLIRTCQNKNQFVPGYLMWRVMTGRHQEIEYLMQIPGHARCYVDGGFALLKQRYRKTDCDTMDHLQEAVDSSSSTNEAVRYPAWTKCDWKTFLSAKFRPVRGVRSYQYFRFSSAEPGILTVRRTGNDDVETKINICKWENIDRDATPETMEPGGLKHQRQAYLFKTVRPYVRPSFQDVTCPPPVDG